MAASSTVLELFESPKETESNLNDCKSQLISPARGPTCTLPPKLVPSKSSGWLTFGYTEIVAPISNENSGDHLAPPSMA